MYTILDTITQSNHTSMQVFPHILVHFVTLAILCKRAPFSYNAPIHPLPHDYTPSPVVWSVPYLPSEQVGGASQALATDSALGRFSNQSEDDFIIADFWLALWKYREWF